jgi:hypothetical protein
MTRCALWAGGVALLAGVGLVTGAPLESTKRVVELKLEPYSGQTFWRPFEAGKPVRLIASGKQDASLGLYVFDKDGNCVAHDDNLTPPTSNREQTFQLRAVDFVPTRDGDYTLEVRAVGKGGNEILFTVRQQAGQ